MLDLLDTVCAVGEYSYDYVYPLAEIYRPGDVTPFALFEQEGSNISVHFRIGVAYNEVAVLVEAISFCNDTFDMVYDEDFTICPQRGYVYGADATRTFMATIAAQPTEDDVLEGAMYISTTPIFAHGGGYLGKTKIERFWGDDDDNWDDDGWGDE